MAGKVGLAIKNGLERFLALLYRDTRRQVSPKNRYGYIGSGPHGDGFAAGWTACSDHLFPDSHHELAATCGPAVVPLVALFDWSGYPFLVKPSPWTVFARLF